LSCLIQPASPVVSSLFFFFIVPPLPPPTLFPYTTLFRSLADPLPRRPRRLVQGVRDQNASGGAVDGRIRLPPLPDTAVAAVHERDRKSTRLNSSHRTISYAVFCLKKKTIKTTQVYRVISQ